MFDDLSLKYILNVPSSRHDSDPMPLVLLVHGRGADAHDLYDLAPHLDTDGGCRFVFPNAPQPFEPYPGMAFGWTWFEGWPPERASVAVSRELLLRFIDELTERYATPEGKIVLAGFSQGALMSLDCGLRIQRPIAGVIAMSGGLFEEDLPDLRGNAGKRILITHGTDDDVVPVNYARRARRVLEDAGLEVEYHEYPMAHQVIEDELEVVKAFLERVLG